MEPNPGLSTSRNMRLHGPIAYCPPLGSYFSTPSQGSQKIMKKDGNNARFRKKKRVPNLKQSPRHSEKEQKFFLGAPMKFSSAEKESKWGPMAP